MAYTINKTNGSVLIQLADSKIDQLSTDLTLIGKNVSNCSLLKGSSEYLNIRLDL